jgi:hypothetical protein
VAKSKAERQAAGDPIAGLVRLRPVIGAIAERTENVDDDAAVEFLDAVLRAANPRALVDTVVTCARADDPRAAVQTLHAPPPGGKP